jgi:hypothetical protein
LNSCAAIHPPRRVNFSVTGLAAWLTPSLTKLETRSWGCAVAPTCGGGSFRQHGAAATTRVCHKKNGLTTLAGSISGRRRAVMRYTYRSDLLDGQSVCARILSAMTPFDVLPIGQRTANIPSA